MKKKIVIGIVILLALAWVGFMFYKRKLQNKVMDLYGISEAQVITKSVADLRKMVAEYEKNQNKGAQ